MTKQTSEMKAVRDYIKLLRSDISKSQSEYDRGAKRALLFVDDFIKQMAKVKP